jgi:hypothetical protein
MSEDVFGASEHNIEFSASAIYHCKCMWMLFFQTPIIFQIFIISVAGGLLYVTLSKLFGKSFDKKIQRKAKRIMVYGAILIPLYLSNSIVTAVTLGRAYLVAFPCRNPVRINVYFDSCSLHGVSEALFFGVFVGPVLTTAILVYLYKAQRYRFKEILLYWLLVAVGISLLVFVNGG